MLVTRTQEARKSEVFTPLPRQLMHLPEAGGDFSRKKAFE